MLDNIMQHNIKKRMRTIVSNDILLILSARGFFNVKAVIT
jgi:hypothetical protein